MEAEASKDGAARKKRKVVVEVDSESEVEIDDESENEIVNCPCGRREEEHLPSKWVCCDVCDEWSNADCVGYAHPSPSLPPLPPSSFAKKIVWESRGRGE